MELLDDQVEVFALLEECDRARFDPRNDRIDIFLDEGKFNLLLFCAEGKMKGARLYRLPGDVTASELEHSLLSEIMTLKGDSHFESLLTSVLDKIREQIESRSAHDYYFDAH